MGEGGLAKKRAVEVRRCLEPPTSNQRQDGVQQGRWAAPSRNERWRGRWARVDYLSRPHSVTCARYYFGGFLFPTQVLFGTASIVALARRRQLTAEPWNELGQIPTGLPQKLSIESIFVMIRNSSAHHKARGEPQVQKVSRTALRATHPVPLHQRGMWFLRHACTCGIDSGGYHAALAS